MMQASLPIIYRIVLQIKKKTNDFSIVCTEIIAMKMLILRLMLPRKLLGYLKTKTFLYVVYISIAAIVV